MIKPLGWFYLISIVFFFIFPPVLLVVIPDKLFMGIGTLWIKASVDKFYPKKKIPKHLRKIYFVGPGKAIMVFART